MKIAYIANARMPTEKAHGLQIMHMCRAFTQIGHEVTLIVPRRKNWIDKTIWEFYGMEPCFKMIQVPVFDFILYDKWLGNFSLWFITLLFGLKARRIVEDLDPDVVYSRDPFSSVWTPKWVPNVFEAHTFPNRMLWFYRFLWKKCDRIVSLTHGLQKMFEEQGLPKDMLRVAADAVDLETFKVSETKEESRKALNLPLDKFLVVYAGHLYPYKGIPDLVESASKLHPDVRLVIVGGRKTDLDRTKELAERNDLKNVIFIGRVLHKEVPRYLHAADITVMPYTKESHHVEHYSSPLKLFEYLAAERAILTTDLPAVREILNDDTAEFVPPEDPIALAEGINRLHADKERVKYLDKISAELAKKYTWKKRAVNVLAALPKPKMEWKVTFYKKYRLEIQIAILAFAIRLIYVTLFPQHTIFGGDGEFYLRIADVFLGLKEPLSNAGSTFFQPLYPMILAGIKTIFGESITWIRVFQAAFSAVTVFTMMMIARRWASAYAAWITGLIGALHVPMILESGILYTETTYTMFLTVGIYLLLVGLETSKLKYYLVSGIVFMLAGLTRDLGVYTAILLAMFAGLYKKSWKVVIIFLLPVLLSVSIVSWNNQQIAKERTDINFVPVISKGYESTLMESGFQKAAFAPNRLYMYPLGVYYFFRFPFRLLDISDGTAIKELIVQRNWPELRTVMPQFASKSVLLLLHMVILGFAVFGLLKGNLSKNGKIVFFLAIAFAAGTIILGSVGRTQGFATFEPLARYRFPVEPLIIILSAVGIEKWSRWRESKNRSIQ